MSAGAGDAQRTKRCNRPHKSRPLQMAQYLVDAHRRIAKRGGLLANHLHDTRRSEVDDIQHEVVGGLGFNAVPIEHTLREVVQIVGHDHLGTGSNRGGEDVTVVRVWQGDAHDKGLVSRDEAVRDRLAHALGRPAHRIDIRASLLDDASDHLVQDLRAPSGSEEPGLRKPDQKIPERRWMQHAGVIDDGEGQGQLT